MDDLGSNHRAWQQRLGRERTPQRYALVIYRDEAHGGSSCSSATKQAAPRHLRGSTSEPSLAPSRGSTGAGGRRGPRSAPQSAGEARPQPGAKPGGRALRAGTPAVTRGAAARTQGSNGGRQGRWLPEPPLARTQTGASSFRRSGELVLINNGTRRSVPPTPSLRTAVTGASVDSALWREVEEVVQQEVARFVKPLQEQLRSEAEARQRVEAALRSAGVEPASVH
uniref:Uncharacterized protein n=1 Tax=Pyrodinium bahamense TaxID=73915 RepID=A0A7S0BAE7_9DINO|mmetsp:Transcript_55061/g.152602  ORF Transcript_55061/g.152602 Transcript_55061/m.152602 type:complete len:225 (+) Transcript_55061:191-865(+)